MKHVTMNMILQDAKDCGNEGKLKTAKLQFAQFLGKHPEQKEEIVIFLTELLDSTYDETNLPVDLKHSTPKIELTKMFDLNSYCKFLGIKSNSKDYQNMRQKLTFARERNQIKGEQQNLSNGKMGKKYQYSLSALKEFTLLKVPERLHIFNEAISHLNIN